MKRAMRMVRKSACPRLAWIALMALVTGLASAGCSQTNVLVGGACAEGFIEVDKHCVPQEQKEVSDASPQNDEKKPILCTEPALPTLCGVKCVDTTSDPDNCGRCGKVCDSRRCKASKCVGEINGYIVVIGHDYLSPGPDAQQDVLRAAISLGGQNGTREIVILEYKLYADSQSVDTVHTILKSHKGLAYEGEVSADPIDVLKPSKANVLLIYNQTTDENTLAKLGKEWKPVLEIFLTEGRVVVVLNAQDMKHFVTHAGLLKINTSASITGKNVNIAPKSWLQVGSDQYMAGQNTISFTSDEFALKGGGTSVDAYNADKKNAVVVRKVLKNQ